MKTRSSIAVAIVFAVLLVLVGVAYAVDSSRSDTIAKGVTIDGVAVGGMTAAQARALVASRLQPQLHSPVRARYGGRDFTLSARAAGVNASTTAIVGQALARSRQGWFVGRSLDALVGRSLNLEISPVIGYSQAAVDRFVAHVAHALDHPTQNASVAFDGSGPHVVRDRRGVTVLEDELRASVAAAVAGGGGRSVEVPADTTPAALKASDLPARYPAAIVIDRPAFQLRLYKHLRLVKTYPVAIGMQGLETPAGTYHVQEKQVDPSWAVPDSPWAGSLAGQVIPPGPDDPIKARWIGFDGSAGIHGTDETDSIGTAGSHGCVRMLIPDVEELFPQVSVGDVVYVA